MLGLPLAVADDQQLALHEARGEACMLVNIDQDPGEEVLSSLRDAENMIAVQLLEL